MFTGIVTEVGRIVSSSPGDFAIEAPGIRSGLEVGGSVAVNGACLTVTRLGVSSFVAEVMPETLRRTNLGLLHPGDRVNLELPVTLSTPLGGHLVQGHVDTVGRIASLIAQDGATIIRVRSPIDIMHYVVEKGFVAVDGISLTVIAKSDEWFDISVVRHTLLNTNLGLRRPGDMVNLEADIIAKYVEQLTLPKKGIDMEYLREHGFWD